MKLLSTEPTLPPPSSNVRCNECGKGEVENPHCTEVLPTNLNTESPLLSTTKSALPAVSPYRMLAGCSLFFNPPAATPHGLGDLMWALKTSFLP